MRLFWVLRKKGTLACTIFGKICYVACAINCTGQLICLCAILHRLDPAGLIDKPGRDILGNSRIRISDPWEKSAPTKRFETLFWWDYKYPCPQVKVFFYFQKGLFISRTALVVFSRKPFYFPEVSFSFRELPFCLLEGPISFPEVAFYFS